MLSSRILTVAAILIINVFTSNAFSSNRLPIQSHSHRLISATPSHPSHPSQLSMSLSDVSEFYADFPLQAAVLTCGIKASVADGIAQIRSLESPLRKLEDIEFRRNLAYVLYGGIFIGALCHYEYDVMFPILFGIEHNLSTSIKEVLFDNFISGPIMILPPSYLIKAIIYDYSLREGLQKYVNDIKSNGLLLKYWSIWIPAQSVSFTVVPDHLRVVFMASVSFFWFILFSTVSSSSDEKEMA